MRKAVLRIEMENAKDYLGIIDKKIDYKRSKVRITGDSKSITIEVSATDSRALLASLNGALKQLRIVSNVDLGLSEE
jgi:tRNA threonylcarbamoyladenosine modification (KEOPS) complex  Pcc1 subunit